VSCSDCPVLSVLSYSTCYDLGVPALKSYIHCPVLAVQDCPFIAVQILLIKKIQIFRIFAKISWKFLIFVSFHKYFLSKSKNFAKIRKRKVLSTL
jgi:hypothetical protein